MKITLIAIGLLMVSNISFGAKNPTLSDVFETKDEGSFGIIKDSQNRSYLATNFKTPKGTLLISSVNPIEHNGPLSKVYNTPNHPVNWKEAKNACPKLKTGGYNWVLPEVEDFESMSDIGLDLLLFEGGYYSKELSHNHQELIKRGSQYYYFWAIDQSKQSPEGLRTAYRLNGSPVTVLHTMEKPMQLICVSYLNPQKKDKT